MSSTVAYSLRIAQVQGADRNRWSGSYLTPMCFSFLILLPGKITEWFAQHHVHLKDNEGQLKSKPIWSFPWRLESKIWALHWQCYDNLLTQDIFPDEEEPGQPNWLLSSHDACNMLVAKLGVRLWVLPQLSGRSFPMEEGLCPLLNLQSTHNKRGEVQKPVTPIICVNNDPNPKKQTEVKRNNTQKKKKR